MSEHGFEGFSPEGLSFLAELGSADKAWFHERRALYERAIAVPAKEFVVDLTERLHASLSPGIVGRPRVNGSISPINNDLRFAPERDPYKDHLLFRFWEGESRRTAPTLFVRVSQATVGFASGVSFASRDSWREAVAADRGAELADAIAALSSSVDLNVVGDELKRVPAPYGADHPRGDLLRHTSFQVRWSEPTPEVVSDPGFVAFCAERLGRPAAVHHWLVANL